MTAGFHFFLGDEGKANIEVIILVSTGAAATFLWIMLILFIRKLRKVSPNIIYFLKNKCIGLLFGKMWNVSSSGTNSSDFDNSDLLYI